MLIHIQSGFGVYTHTEWSILSRIVYCGVGCTVASQYFALITPQRSAIPEKSLALEQIRHISDAF